MILGSKNKRFIFVAALLIALVTVFVGTSNSDDYNIDALNSSARTKTITITKVWDKDEESVRPSDATVHLDKTISILLPGCQNSSACSVGTTNTLEYKIKSIAGSGGFDSNNTNITAIKHATKAQYEAKVSSLTSANEAQSSGEKTYMWFENGTIYYYSEASTIYLAADSDGIFRKMTALTDISGLADFNTSYVTDMNRIFQNSTALANLSPLASWDTSSVTDMTFAFGGSGISSGNCTTKMSYSDLSPLANWNVSSVDSFYQTFKCSVYVDSLDDLSGWVVSNATNMAQMFNNIGKDAGGADVGGIKDWDVVAVTNTTSGGSANGFQGMFNNSFDLLTNRQVFSKRPGSWSGGTYLTTSSAVSPATPVPPGTPTPSSYICSGADWVKSGNTWTCTKTDVVNDGSNYWTWEDDITNYEGACGGTTCTSSDKAIFDTKNNTFSVTNTNKLYKEIDVTKQWVGDSVYSGARPTDITARVLKNGAEVKVSDNAKWVKNGATWTYQFVVYDNSLSGYTITEDTVPRYDTQIPALTIDANTGYGSTTITNTLKTYTLTATKKITGNMADINETFDYAINVYDWYNNQVAAFSTSGTWGHGDVVPVAGIPDGFTYDITESNVDTYNVYSEIKDTSSGAVIQPITQGLSTAGTLDSDQTVTFTNNKEKAPITGVFQDKTPFTVIVAAVTGLTTSFISFYCMRKFKPKIRDG